MSNALAIYAKVESPAAFALEMGKTFAAMTGVPVEQGPAVALTCLIEGLTPVGYRRRYHTVDGKPTMRADAMLAEFRMNHGGKYRVVDRTPERAAVALIDKDGEETLCEFTWAEASESRWPWVNWKERDPAKRALKDNWATPTDRRTMLWARCVSDGLRAVCPELVAGVYTPEEIQDTIDDRPPAVARKTASEIISAELEGMVDDTLNTMAGQATGDVEASGLDPGANGDPGPIDAEFEPAAEPAEATPGTITDAQRKEIEDLYAELNVSLDVQSAALAKRGVNAVRSLSKEQASEILDKLRQHARAKRGN